MSSAESWSWNITGMKKCPNSRIHLLGPTNIGLDTVMAYDIEIETTIGNKRKGRKMMLYGVPLFLVEAFTWLDNNNAWNVEGIFRKVGNASRCRNPWKIYCGILPIPENCTINDVCSLIKGFFAVLNTPILGSQQSQIMSYGSTPMDENILIEALFSIIDQLPAENKATLGYLMRQLKKISERAETNQMTVQNLAIVFAPAIFKDATESRSSSSIWASSDSASIPKIGVGRSLPSLGVNKRKKIAESMREMDFMKRRNDLKVSIVKLLIQYANHICVPQVTSNRGLLSRKSSDLQRPRKAPILGEITPASHQQQGRGRTSLRTNRIWPRTRSASETAFNRTRAFFNFPFGKNGSFAPTEEQSDKNIPKVQQSRQIIPCHSPANNLQVSIQFLSSPNQQPRHDLQPHQSPSTLLTECSYNNGSNHAMSTSKHISSNDSGIDNGSSSRLFQRLFF